MAESEEAEVDYCAVLNVRKEVKIVFQRDRKEKYLISRVKCILLHFRQTKMNLKLLTDASECYMYINLTNINIPRKRK